MTNHSINLRAGGRIKRLRRIMGLSQADLGDAIGVSYQQVQKYENGKTSMNMEALERISTVLNIAPHELIAVSDNDNSGSFNESRKKLIRESLHSNSAEDLLGLVNQIEWIEDEEVRVSLKNFITSIVEHKKETVE